MSLSALKQIMEAHSDFENEFHKELQKCYREAREYSESNDDRNAAMKLAQATVWDNLHKLAKPKN